MIQRYVQQITGRASTRGFSPSLNHLPRRLNLGFLKATLVATAVLAGLSF